MAVRSKSASTNRTSRLTLKASVVTLLVFWVRQSGFSAVPTILFAAAAIFFYLRPPLHASRYLPSALALSTLPFFVPRVVGVGETTLVLVWGVLFLSLLGVKNVVLLRRKEVYSVIHLAIVAVLSAVLFARFNFTLQIALFVVFLFLFREFYYTSVSSHPERVNLIAATEALIVIEFAWVISFLSINFLAGAALLTLLMFTLHDTALHSLRDTLSREVALRNAVVFSFFATLIVLLPV